MCKSVGIRTETNRRQSKMRGTVAMFSSQKGFGFISPDDGGSDVFVYWRALVMDGYRRLNPGDVVEYEVEMGAKGPQACAVRKVG